MKVRPIRSAAVASQATLTYVALARLARGRERRGPLAVPAWAGGVTVGGAAAGGAAAVPAAGLGPGAAEGQAPRISVVVPARDEEARIAGVLAPLRAAPGVTEVIVVDDRSSDGTAAIARAHGATVIEGGELPEGWIGKPWALQQGLAAATGDVVVFLDADVRPDPALPAAVASLLGDADLVSAQLAFSCPGIPQRVLHPALLATLIYRLGPLDTTQRAPYWDAAINGQCFAARRAELLGAGGFGLVAGVSTDDVALARSLSSAGWRIAVADGSGLGSVRMYESAGEALREWAGRSLGLPGASSQARMIFDLAIVWSLQGRPGLRLWRVLWRLARGRTRRVERHAAARYVARELTAALRAGAAVEPAAGRRWPSRAAGLSGRGSFGGRSTRLGRRSPDGANAAGWGTKQVGRSSPGWREAIAGIALPGRSVDVVERSWTSLRRADPAPLARHPDPRFDVALYALTALRRTDYAALALRAALQVALLRTYRRGGRAAGRQGSGYPDPLSLLAPLLDPVAAAALTRGTLAPVREWRGRRM